MAKVKIDTDLIPALADHQKVTPGAEYKTTRRIVGKDNKARFEIINNLGDVTFIAETCCALMD